MLPPQLSTIYVILAALLCVHFTFLGRGGGGVCEGHAILSTTTVRTDFSSESDASRGYDDENLILSSLRHHRRRHEGVVRHRNHNWDDIRPAAADARSSTSQYSYKRLEDEESPPSNLEPSPRDVRWTEAGRLVDEYGTSSDVVAEDVVPVVVSWFN